MGCLWAGMAFPGGDAGQRLPPVDDCPQNAPSASGRGGWLASEWVAGLDWIQWLVCVGITGWIPSEPAVVHAARQLTLDRACRDTPERFVNQPPKPPAKPTAAWINPPVRTPDTQA